MNKNKKIIWISSFPKSGNTWLRLILSGLFYTRDGIINDFNLFRYCKHFIVGPSSFHWWGAWLNNNPDKICIRPSKINPSNNKNFWPEDWMSI